MGVKVATVERELAALARRSHGVVTRRELLRAGISAKQIERRLRAGALFAEFRGVYRVGHTAPSVEAHYLATVKACGAEALLSGQAAAHLLGLLKGQPPPPEVTTPNKRQIEGVRTRRGGRRGTTWRGVPVTTPAETLVDLAAAVDERELARACHEAGVRHHTTPKQVEAVLARRANTPGAAKLRRVLRGDAKVSLSKLESAFLALLRDERLPLPETNRPAGGRRVDCRWPRLKLTVELDSYRYHRSRHAWEQDRRREREAYARGDDFRRYTYGDVFESPRLMMEELRLLLRSAQSAPSSPR
jgi:very-short-patch-repair endonuclease